jgi:hypothetical protein
MHMRLALRGNICETPVKSAEIFRQILFLLFVDLRGVDAT